MESGSNTLFKKMKITQFQVENYIKLKATVFIFLLCRSDGKCVFVRLNKHRENVINTWTNNAVFTHEWNRDYRRDWEHAKSFIIAAIIKN